jgi:opacity protein-like surface antigen
LNLRLEGIALGKSDEGSEDAKMGGVGLSLRYRPWRAFAIDAGVDVIGGTDYNGDKRMETPLSLNGLLYVNPKSRVQFYFMGGVHWSRAKVELPSTLAEGDFIDDWSNEGNKIEYTYFGGQLGAGLDFRLWRHVSLFIDGVGFMRERTDDNPRPEFTDPDTGRTTNTSGGGMFRGGMTIWW